MPNSGVTFGYSQDTIDTVLFTDGIKRVLQTKKAATVAGQDVMIVSGRMLFDAMGRTVQQYYPVTEAKGAPPAPTGWDRNSMAYVFRTGFPPAT